MSVGLNEVCDCGHVKGLHSDSLDICLVCGCKCLSFKKKFFTKHYVCDLCGSKFVSLRSVKNHFRRKH